LTALRWFVSPHAGRRYVKRIEPRLSLFEAIEYLRRALPDATLLPERTWNGEQRWALYNRKAIVIAKHDPIQDRHVALTVIPPDVDAEVEDEVMAAFQRLTAGAAR
jgi:hypothetical protein